MKQDQRSKKIANIIWTVLAIAEVLLSCVMWIASDAPGWAVPFIAFGFIFAVLVVVIIAVNATYEAVLVTTSFINKMINKYKG